MGIENSAHKEILDLLAVGPHIYQPLYNYPYDVPKPLRGCEDRCKAVATALGQLNGLNILDIGCSFGYNSLYFAERGARVTGIDFSERNIKICQGIQEHTNGDIAFHMAKFDFQYIVAIQPGAVDVVFIFNVLHHVMEQEGLEAVQGMMANLVANVSEIYVELALANENPIDKYQVCFTQSLPENELDFFATCVDVTIDLIGYFPSHVSEILRPIYRVKSNRSTLTE
ncbi:MAG: class I SAM-dependent methyltransferase [Rhizobiales bacterium]|nr:class I SAM-dependent methyltransferase [Hyphomicrobiales bacterium]NRB15800.1 class I SAM-dependent methyltransferase [Hyphomicrobiales bacterium]